MGMVVAIDGPAGSGKGTVAKKIAEELGFVKLDTGATYRCVAYMAIKRGFTAENEKEIVQMIENEKIEIQFKKEEEKEKVFLNGEDVTTKIREKEVTKNVSPISSIIPVRLKMVELQRKLARGKDVVIEGRDIGTYVFPNAELKIYLDASVEERAKRRYKENKGKGIDMTYEEILENVKFRDYTDMNKKLGALKKADDAIIIDSTNLEINEVVDRIKKLIKERKK